MHQKCEGAVGVCVLTETLKMIKGIAMKCLSIFLAGIVLLLVSGCAKESSKIAPAYVSPLKYQEYSCTQLRDELTRIGSRLVEVTGAQDQAASSDTTNMTVSMILFWPALFFLEGDTGREAELGRLKGDLDAIEQVAVQKNCNAVLAGIEKNRREAMEAWSKKAKKQGQKRKCHAGYCWDDEGEN